MSIFTEKIKFTELLDSSNHTVLYKIDENSKPYCDPHNFINRWDDNHVRMPCCCLSFHPIDSNGKKSLIPRWPLIEKSFKTDVADIHDIKRIILSYNPKYETQWNFDVLCGLFENELDHKYKQEFFSETYPGMVKLALNLPKIVTKPIPLLKSQMFHSISLSQMQIASLLVHAFFCTYPRRNHWESEGEYRLFPSINFSSLFNSNINQRNFSNKNKMEKLKCILHYFKRVVHEMPSGVVTFTKRVLRESDLVKWSESDSLFTDIQLETNNVDSIFTSGVDSIKIDFANRSVGGGVLNRGSVQEEILFMTQPELIVSRLFTEILGDNETLLVSGTELFSLHNGYARTFTFRGDFNETEQGLVERDRFGRWKNTISMMDALHFNSNDNQFVENKMLRELNKAYCGFCDIMTFEESLPNSISTGNWGCGAFGGDLQLKFILQIMACSELKKNVVYYTFTNEDLAEKIRDVFHYLQDSQSTIGSLWSHILKYSETTKTLTLFDYIQFCDMK